MKKRWKKCCLKKNGSTIKLMLFSVCSFVLMYNWCNTQKINKLNSFKFTNFQQKTTNFIHIDLNFLPGEKENSSNSLFITKLSSLNNQANIWNTNIHLKKRTNKLYYPRRLYLI